jgi:hypothetical protein
VIHNKRTEKGLAHYTGAISVFRLMINRPRVSIQAVNYRAEYPADWYLSM